MTSQRPWVSSRGLARLLAQETNVSDLIQELSDRDSRPWEEFVGFRPVSVEREARLGKTAAFKNAGSADLLLRGDGAEQALIEVKLGHVLGEEQQAKCESWEIDPTGLHLIGFSADRHRVTEAMRERWSFLALPRLLGAWTRSTDANARALARQALPVIRAWDDLIASVLEPDGVPLTALTEKFAARLVTRRMAVELQRRDLWAFAGVTSGGGLPVVQAWAPTIDPGDGDRCFIAEVRWWDSKPGGELRFGVDYTMEPTPQTRRESYDLAMAMIEAIDVQALKRHLESSAPQLAAVITRSDSGRPAVKGSWEDVIQYGLLKATVEGQRRQTRQTVNPGFYGDRTQRFQAVTGLDFSQARASDIIDLITETLSFLQVHRPSVAPWGRHVLAPGVALQRHAGMRPIPP